MQPSRSGRDTPWCHRVSSGVMVLDGSLFLTEFLALDKASGGRARKTTIPPGNKWFQHNESRTQPPSLLPCIIYPSLLDNILRKKAAFQ